MAETQTKPTNSGPHQKPTTPGGNPQIVAPSKPSGYPSPNQPGTPRQGQPPKPNQPPKK